MDKDELEISKENYRRYLDDDKNSLYIPQILNSKVFIKIILSLLLNGVIIITIMFVTYFITYIALSLGISDDFLLSTILKMSSGFYIIIYLILNLISILRLLRSEVREMRFGK